ncbi:aldose epimerase family protein [Prevotella sp. OH937_COT-195]|uniref:aldose epimerase family protein n=1 Tax=Prevotella sp. OH937_COT-195 TaxID=2491051 RepID=UPI000F6474DC|nr:aldose epimerase family protein [Prevotella sp. OH937_COT-195]RRD01994.1 galactose mutarotase [Prevotella sp. OH937_COT-195]
MKKSETQSLCGLKRSDFQTTINGKNTDLYILKNSAGCEVAVTNYGGALMAVMMPDKNGNMANVVQGYGNIKDLINSKQPFRSTLVGRFANRIDGGSFKLNGKQYQLSVNCDGNTLHGGEGGFHSRVWDAFQMSDNTLVLNYTSPYLEEGFTGEVKTTVVYNLSDTNELVIGYMATTNKKTIINLTNHAYFSLAGTADPTPSINNLECEINADFYLPINENSIPTGEILKVNGTPFDFRKPKILGKDIDADNEQIRRGGGYDHCFVLNKKEEGELTFATRIKEPESGRTMEVYTTEPGMQMYSDNDECCCNGKTGETFPRRSAICFEAQHFPDSPNRPYFPSVVLRPGQQYKQKTIYRFGVEK